MIKSVTIDNNFGESMTIKLEDPEVLDEIPEEISPEMGIFITEIEGLGPVKANINMAEVATQHGARYISSRANTRDITFHFRFLDINGVTAEDCRLKTYKYFPLGEKVKLTIRTGQRTVVAYGYVESNEPEIFLEQVASTITVSCPSSWFVLQQPNKTIDYTFSNLDAMFEFEFEDPVGESPSLIFSEIEHNKVHEITYAGEAETGMVITISNVQRNFPAGVEWFAMPTIYDIETGEFMKIDTDVIEKTFNPSFDPSIVPKIYQTCVDSSSIVISTVTDNKYVRYIHTDGTTYNVLAALSLDSSWLKIHPGVNKFSYTCDHGDIDVDVNIKATVLISGV